MATNPAAGGLSPPSNNPTPVMADEEKGDITVTDSAKLDQGSLKQGSLEQMYSHERRPDMFAPLIPHSSFKEELSPLTFRAVLTGWLLGGLVNAGNIYLGLKSGIASDATMLGAFVGYAALKAYSHLRIPFFRGDPGPKENSLIQAVATATGGLSTFFFASVPAMFRLGILGPNVEDEYWRMVALTAASGLFGSGIAPLYRRLFVIELGKQLDLVYPTAIAVATTIHSLNIHDERSTYRKSLKALYITFAASIVWVVVSSYAKGILFQWHISWWFYAWGNYKNLAIYAVNWGFVVVEWTPAFIGIGTLIPLNSSASWLLGYVLGFGIIGPILVSQGKAIGYAYSAEYPDLVTFLSIESPDLINLPSPRYWLILPSTFIIIAAAGTDTLYFWRNYIISAKVILGSAARSLSKRAPNIPWLIRLGEKGEQQDDLDPAPKKDRIRRREWMLFSLLAVVLSCAVLKTQYKVDIGLTILSLVLAIILSVMLVICTGQAGTSPATVISSTVQITVGGINRSNGMSVPDNMLSNLAAGTLTAAGSQQVAEMVTDFKIGFFLGTPPRLQWYAQILGCLPAIFLSPGLFILVSKAYGCVLDPSQAATCPFTAPAVSLWTVLATAVVEPTLPIPQSSWIFSIGISVFSIAVHLLRNWARENNYRKIYNFTPNMVMVALGLIVPAIQYSIALVIGGIIALVWLRKWPASHALYLFPVAAGMIAGESIGGIFNAILTLAKVSGPTYYGTTIGCPAGMC